ncbi:MAG: MoaD/ThiS family protein [Chloroflexi bacterium]|nr:MoaD/ThiS family protein [Chloroflexota bacterium]MCL5074403.1 MoaD/ThiS family protein [Chloroflexota bacterium]
MIRLVLVYRGFFRNLVGLDREILELSPGSDLSSALRAAVCRHTELGVAIDITTGAIKGNILVGLNGQVLNPLDNPLLQSGDVLELVPPAGGG